MSKYIIQQLISKIRCYECGEHYNLDNIEIIENKDDTWYLNVFCTSCHKQSFIVAIIKTTSKSELHTDLTEDELAQFAGSRPVDADYLLDLHSFLKDFSGDFSQLFDNRNLPSEL